MNDGVILVFTLVPYMFVGIFLLGGLVVGIDSLLRTRSGSRLWWWSSPSVQLGHKTFRSFERFLDEFGLEVGLTGKNVAEKGKTPKVTDALFEGEIEGRAASIEFKPEGMSTLARISVECDRVHAFTITDAFMAGAELSLLQRLVHGPPRSIKSGDPALDRRIHVSSPKEDRTQSALGHPELRQLVRAVFGRPFLLGVGQATVLARGGALSVEIPTEELKQTEYRELLEMLVKASKSIARVDLDVRVLGGARRVFIGQAGKPRCAYCHEDVTGNEPDLVACGSCSTVLHESCWADNGHCPVLGCAGKTPERARTR